MFRRKVAKIFFGFFLVSFVASFEPVFSMEEEMEEVAAQQTPVTKPTAGFWAWLSGLPGNAWKNFMWVVGWFIKRKAEEKTREARLAVEETEPESELSPMYELLPVSFFKSQATYAETWLTGFASLDDFKEGCSIRAISDDKRYIAQNFAKEGYFVVQVPTLFQESNECGLKTWYHLNRFARRLDEGKSVLGVIQDINDEGASSSERIDEKDYYRSSFLQARTNFFEAKKTALLSSLDHLDAALKKYETLVTSLEQEIRDSAFLSDEQRELILHGVAKELSQLNSDIRSAIGEDSELYVEIVAGLARTVIELKSAIENFDWAGQLVESLEKIRALLAGRIEVGIIGYEDVRKSLGNIAWTHAEEMKWLNNGTFYDIDKKTLIYSAILRHIYRDEFGIAVDAAKRDFDAGNPLYVAVLDGRHWFLLISENTQENGIGVTLVDSLWKDPGRMTIEQARKAGKPESVIKIALADEVDDSVVQDEKIDWPNNRIEKHKKVIADLIRDLTHRPS